MEGWIRGAAPWAQSLGAPLDKPTGKKKLGALRQGQQAQPGREERPGAHCLAKGLRPQQGPSWAWALGPRRTLEVALGAQMPRSRGPGGMQDAQARGWVQIPCPESWRRLSAQGSLRQGWPLGSAQPACVVRFLRVGSSSIHCGRARRAGAYHPHREEGRRGGGPRMLRSRCGSATRGRDQGRRAAPAPAPAPHLHPSRPGARGAAEPVGGWVRGEAGDGAGTAKAEPLVLPARTGIPVPLGAGVRASALLIFGTGAAVQSPLVPW